MTKFPRDFEAFRSSLQKCLLNRYNIYKFKRFLSTIINRLTLASIHSVLYYGELCFKIQLPGSIIIQLFSTKRYSCQHTNNGFDPFTSVKVFSTEACHTFSFGEASSLSISLRLLET